MRWLALHQSRVIIAAFALLLWLYKIAVFPLLGSYFYLPMSPTKLYTLQSISSQLTAEELLHYTYIVHR